MKGRPRLTIALFVLVVTACGTSDTDVTASDVRKDVVLVDQRDTVADKIVPIADQQVDVAADVTRADSDVLTTAKTWLDNTLADFPKSLSALGIFKDMATREVVDSRLKPYAPHYPLWTDGSTKSRWIYLPIGTRIDNSGPDWTFPNGTVFVKHFAYPGQPVETRILRKRNEQWDAVSFRWNEAEDDASLLAGDEPQSVVISGNEGLNYQIPSRSQCLACHETNVSMIIGFDALRLNSKGLDGENTQLQSFDELGWFKVSPKTIPMITGSAIERKVKAYLHGNCAHCHNNGSANSTLDLTHDKVIAQTVNVDTDGFGTKRGKRIVPGDLDKSLLYQMVINWNLDAELKNMPLIGVSKIDPALGPMLREWIEGLAK